MCIRDSRILIRKKDGNLDEYKLSKFVRSNQGTCMNQRPIVTKGDEVETGQVIADGPSTSGGEIALGKNPLIGFMTWEGYNYEDAVLLSERLVQEDVYTSVHINEYETEARDTKLGPEEITRDVPGVGDDALKDLDAVSYTHLIYTGKNSRVKALFFCDFVKHIAVIKRKPQIFRNLLRNCVSLTAVFTAD